MQLLFLRTIIKYNIGRKGKSSRGFLFKGYFGKARPEFSRGRRNAPALHSLQLVGLPVTHNDIREATAMTVLNVKMFYGISFVNQIWRWRMVVSYEAIE